MEDNTYGIMVGEEFDVPLGFPRGICGRICHEL